MKWRRAIGWTIAGLLLLVLVGAVGGYLFLKSSNFQQYALRKIVQGTDEATGGRTQIRGLDFNLSTLTAHLYDVVVRGTERPDQPPLLQVDKLTVALKIQSVLRRQISLSELVIEHPVVHLQVNQDGKSNIPHTPPSKTSSHASVFDLAVRHLLLTRGEINYNDRKTPVEADLYNLGTDIHFDSFATRYSGSISYDNGHLQYAQYAPLPHNFTAKFTATPALFSLESAVMKVGSSAISLRADVTNYNNPTVAGDYDIRIHTQDLAAMSPAITPAGDVSLTGRIHYQNVSGQTLLRSVAIDGQMGSDGISAASSSGRLDVRKLQGRYQLANGALRAHDIQLDSLGGQINADVDIQHLDTSPVSQLRASLHSISLQAAQQAIRRPDLKRVFVAGTLNGTAEASWKGSVSNLIARSDLSVRAGASNKANRSATNVPVDGVIHVTYDGPRNIITLRQTTLHIPSTTLTADGQVSNHSDLKIQATASDLHHLVALASAFRPSPSPTPEVSGSAELNVVVQGSMQRPHIGGQLNAQDLHVQGSDWKQAALTLQLDPSQVVISKGSLVSAKRGTASFSGTVGLQNWAYLPSNSIKANLSVQQMPVTDLQRLANLQYPVSGDLSANISLSGSQLNPSGSGSAQIANARAYDEPLQNLAVKFHADKGSIATTLNVAMPAGSTNASLTYTPKTKAYKVRLDAPSIVLQKLHTLQAKNLPLDGTLTASASGEGTLDNPQLTATLQLPKLELRQQSISGLKAEVRVANQRANLTLDSQVAEASVRARGQVNLTGDYYTEASIDTTAVPLDALLATYVTNVPEGFHGQSEFHASVKGPLKNKSQLEAHLTIPTLNASYQSLQIEAAGPIRADYSQSVVTLQPSEIRGTGTSLRLQGNLPLAGSTAPNLTAQGSVDLRVLRIVAPDVQSSGTLSLDIHASGTAQNPDVQGQVHLQNVAMSTATAPLGVEKLNGTLDIAKDRVQLSTLTGQVGGGQVSVGGSVAYRPSLQFDIALKGSSVRLRYPDGIRTLLNTNLAFTGTTASSTLNGRVLIDSLSFTPEFDLATFGDDFSGNAATPAQPGFADTVQLAIGVQSQENLSATSSQVSLEGRVDLRVGGTAANPVITGRTDLTAGELFYRNVRYQLERGVITFADPNETTPVLNVSVSTIVEQYNLTLNLRGPFDKLTTSYVSDPPLPTADIINLIARGKTTQESAATSQSTDSMIASQAASQVSSSVQKLAGISSLQIDPLLGGNNQNPSARVAIQQRVTKNFLFTFSTDVSQPGTEIVQGDYKLNKRWSVSVARDQVGGVSVDGKFHTSF
jgi:translocation and assembly module TamB